MRHPNDTPRPDHRADPTRRFAARLRSTVWRDGTVLGLATAVSLAAGPAGANPTGGTVTSGTVTISQPSATEVTVQQQSQRAIVNWTSFSIANGETTRFVQPDAQSVILNRVTGVDSSVIAGRMEANGRVFLLNPNGILVTETGSIDVNSLVATTLPLADGDFLDGRYAFAAGAGTSSATVENRGTITAADRGLAALVAPGVVNSGVIRARTGTVALASERAVTIDFSGDGLVSFEVATAAVDAIVGTSRVDNSGRIEASGGTILLTAEQAGALLDSAITVGGALDAASTVGAGGTVTVSGGGTATVTGTVAADGASGGGRVRVTGGTVAVGGTVTARGSDPNAAGGTVEATTTGTLSVTGTVLATPGTGGRAGALSVDLRNIQVGDVATAVPDGYSFVSGASVLASLNAGTDVTIAASDGGTAGAGNILVADAIRRTAGQGTTTPVLTLRATADITLSAPVEGAAGSGLGLNLLANTTSVGAIDSDPLAGSVIVGAAVDTFGGSFSVSGVGFQNTAAIATGGGTFTVAATGTTTIGGAVTTSGGSFSTSGAGFRNTAATATGGGAVTVSATGTATLGAVVDTSGAAAGRIDISAASVALAADLTSRDAAIAIRAPVALGADVRIAAGSGGIGFSGAIDSNSTAAASALAPRSLTVDSTGTTTFSGLLGTTNALAALTTGSGTVLLPGGATAANATVRVAGGAVRFGGAVALGGDSRIDAGAGTVTFAGAVDSNSTLAASTLPARALTIAAAGGTVFSGRVGAANPLVSLTTGTGPVALDGGTTGTAATVRVNGGDVRLGGPVTLGADTTIEAGSGNVTFTGAVDSNAVATGNTQPARRLTVTTAGTTTFTGRVGTANALAGLTTGSGTLVLSGGSTAEQATLRVANGPVQVGGALVLGADTRIEAGSGAIAIVGAIDSNSTSTASTLASRALTITTTGETTLSGRLGATNALASFTGGNGVTHLAGGTTATAATLRTDGAGISFNGALTLGADTRLEAGAGSVGFAGAVNSNSTTASSLAARSLTVTTTGATTFAGHVGAVNALSALATGPGSVALSGGTALTDPTQRVSAGEVRFGGALTLGADTRIDAGAGPVTFERTIDSSGQSRLFQVMTTGTITFGGDVGATRPLAGLDISRGPVILRAGTIRTDGAAGIGFAGTVTLANDVALSASGPIQFDNRIDNDSAASPRRLHVATPGETAFAGAVGAGAAGPLQSLTTDGAGSLILSTGASTVAAQAYGESALRLAGTFSSGSGGFSATAETVTLTGDTTIRTGAAALPSANGRYDIVLNGIASATGQQPALTLDTPDTARLQGSVAAGSLTVTQRGATRLDGGSLSLASTLSVANPLSLGRDTTITASGTVDLGGTVGGVSGAAAPALTVRATGQTRFGGDVTLRSLAVAGSGRTRIDTGAVTVDDAVSFAADVLLGRDTAVTATSGGIRFAGTVGAPDGSPVRTLTLSAGGTVQADRNLSLTTLTVTRAERFLFGGDSIATTGDLRSASRFEFTGSPTLTASQGAIDLGRDVSGPGTLTVNAATTGRFGGSVDVGSLRTGGQARFRLDGPAITAADAVRFDTPVTVGRDLTVTATAAAGSVTFGAAVDGTAGLLVRAAGTTRFAGPVSLAALETDAPGTTVLGTAQAATGTALSVTTQSAIRFGDAVTLDQDAGLRAGSVDFRQSVASAAGRPAALTVEATGTTRFQGDVGGGDDVTPGGSFGAGALRRLDVTAGGIAFAAPTTGSLLVRTIGGAAETGQRYVGPVTIEGGRVVFDTTNVRDRWEFARGGTLRFDSMTGTASAVDLRVGTASVLPATDGGLQPTVALESLAIYGTGGRIELTGTIRGVSGPAAAQLVFKSLPRSNSFRFNGCAMGSPTCVVAGLADLPSPEGLRLRVERPTGELDNFIAPVLARGNEDLWRKSESQNSTSQQGTSK